MPQTLDNIDERGKTFWEHSYRQTRGAPLWGERHVPFVEHIVGRFTARKCNMVIDVPCGEGRNLIYLARHLPFVFGLDASSTALDALSQKVASERINNCILLKGDLFQLPFRANQFDAVLCWDILGHLQNAQLAIAELTRICKVGGMIVGSLFAIGDSTRGADMKPLGNETYLYRDDCLFHFYTEAEVKDLLKGVRNTQSRIELVAWKEDPHVGYREYEHEHQSWCFTLTK